MGTYEIDEIDLQIIRALQADGRTPNVEIARQVGVTEGTVRKRLERLQSSNIIKVMALPQPAAVGYPVHTMISLQVDAAALHHVTERLVKMPEVFSIYYVTGEADLVVEALFPDTAALTRFLAEEVGKIEGVRKSSTSHVLRVIKSPADWRIPRSDRAEVLVVDDDPDFIAFCQSILEKEGYRVSFTTNGDEALARMRIVRPDLVVLDVMMQGVLDGLNASQAMRADKELAQIPVVMVSSIASSPYAEMFPTDEYVPVNSFLVKPVAPQKLLDEVKKLLRGS
jgi:Lrp/AsnC family transcriptional regulator for asnA, asnC and gidA